MTVDAGDEIFINCEMFGYIKSDSDFLWMKGSVIVRKNDRTSITIRDGAAERGQIGGIVVGSSRVSTLRISDAMESDSGTYTCIVAGTEAAESVQITVVSDMTASKL